MVDHQKAVTLLTQALGEGRRVEVLYRRFVQEPPQTFKAIGETIGVSTERVRQIQAQALTKLRHPCRHWAVLQVGPPGSRLHRMVFGGNTTSISLEQARQRWEQFVSGPRYDLMASKAAAIYRKAERERERREIEANEPFPDLPIYVRQVLRRAGYHKPAQLMTSSDEQLLGMRNFGKHSLVAVAAWRERQQAGVTQEA